MVGKETPHQIIPVGLTEQRTQHRKAIAEKAFQIAPEQIAINVQAPVFNTFRRRLMLRVAQMRGKAALAVEKGCAAHPARLTLPAAA